MNQPTKPEEMLVDDWIDEVCPTDPPEELYAKFVLTHMRMPAVLQTAFREFTKLYILYGKYSGKPVRVNVASRLGDIGVTFDLKRETGYDVRVMVSDITDWSNVPGEPYQPMAVWIPTRLTEHFRSLQTESRSGKNNSPIAKVVAESVVPTMTRQK
ncbi:MAG: hypothetical protein PHN51_10195 [Candidatus Nanopelagicales bacterium]|nr:hypothetical protein [Candidatus Nanopelagicales bacterium]